MLFRSLTLCYHGTAFRLVHDGYEVYAYPGATDPRHALASVWGRDAARDMVPLVYDSPAIRISGFVSKPSLSKASRSSQATFVNGRFVRSRTVQHAFDAAFKHLMTTDRHPVLALFVQIAPELVDVNVHPTKIEVRFTRDGDVYGAVHQAVQNALLTGGLVPEVQVTASVPAGMGTPGQAVPPRTALSSFVDLVAPPSPSPLSPRNGEKGEPEGAGTKTFGELESPATTHLSDSPFLPVAGGQGGWGDRGEVPAYIGFDGHRIGRLRVLGQSRNTYIVAETDDALLLIDQHIAHERVLYEQMMNGATDSASRWGVIAQHLALPQTLELSASEAKVCAERLPALAKAGFVLEAFGGETFLVRAVPARIAEKNYMGALREILDDFTSVSVSRRLLVPHESAVIMASCKMAVKKGDPLTMDEMTRLLTDLAQMRNPFTCPHGRPILLALSHHEMDRKFHRTGVH